MTAAPPDTDRWSLRLLDHVSLRSARGDAGLTARKAVALLIFLALQRDRLARRDTLANLLWSGVDTAQGRVNLRQAIAAIRRVEGAAPLLVTLPDTIALDPAVETDVDAFARLAAGDVADRAEAATLYRTDLAAGFAVRDEVGFNEWLAVERAHWRQRAIDVLLSLADAGQRSGGDVAGGITAALRLLAIDPYNEGGQRALMRLYTRQGRAALALAQYRGFAELLRRELQVAPEPETQALHERIKSGRRDAPPPPLAGPVIADTPDGTPADDASPASRPRLAWRPAVIGSMLALLVASGVLTVRLASQMLDRTPTIRRLFPIAADDTNERGPAISPDGSMVVFTTRRDGNSDLYLSAIGDTGAAQRLTDTPADDGAATWRPDGRAIAFVRTRAGAGAACAIMMRGVPVGREREIARCDGGLAPALSWSGDGDAVYFDGRLAAGRPRRILAVRVDSGRVAPVTDPGTDDDLRPVTSHDGTRIAFERKRGETGELIVRDLAGGTETVVRRDLGQLGGLAWGAGDAGLFYTVFSGADGGLWWVPVVEGGTARRLSSGLQSYSLVSAARSGRRLAVQTSQQRGRFLALGPGGAAVRPTQLPGVAADSFDQLMAQSRRGDIVYRTTRGGRPALLVARAGESSRVVASAPDLDFAWADWSPNGRVIAAAALRGGRTDIVLIDPATRQVRRISPDGASGMPAWSASGRHVYWPTPSALVRLDPARPGRVETVARGRFGLVRFSGDGRFVYFTVFGERGIRRRALDRDGRPTGPEQSVAPDLAAGAHLLWALTPRALYYPRPDPRGVVEVRRIDLAGGGETTVLRAATDQVTFQLHAAGGDRVIVEEASYQNDLSGLDLD